MMILGSLFVALASVSAVEPADVVLRGGAVYTVGAARTWADAVAVREGRIVFVGNDADVEAFIDDTTDVMALDGKMVLPGFHDSHVHVVTGGIELGQCDLNGLATREAVFDTVERCSETRPESPWIVGGGWDLPLFEQGSPRREDLDRLVPDRPAYLSSADGHSAWVNSKALEVAGIDRATPDPANGRIERDAVTGEPSGTLRESAMELVSEHLPALTESDYVDGLRRGLEMANRFGITSVIEANASDAVLNAYWTLARAGELTARTVASLRVDPARGASQIDELVRKRERRRAPRLRPDAVKIFADGVIEAQTAALLEPYVGRDHAGELNFAPEVLDHLVAAADREGFQVHIHAIGDRAIRAALDAIAWARRENGVRDARHHIAHIQLFDPDDIVRFRELDVVANFQPLWAYADTYITDLTEPVLGDERSRWLYPIRSVVERGVVVAGGSDWSVSSMNPLDAIQVALTRRSLSPDEDEASWIPEERVALETMLTAYTIRGAYLQHQEDETGSIEVGKMADLIVLSENLFDVAPQRVHEVEVLLTLVEGAEIYRGEGFESR